MMNAEKVISDLEQCLDDSVAAVVPADTVREAITLLKAQEPVDAIPVEWLIDKELNSERELSYAAWQILSEWRQEQEEQEAQDG